MVETLNSERFCDQAPAQVWATLFDEGAYLASVSTMYRLLRARAQVRERRAQARRPALVKPELVATGPNEVWSWDITKLAGPYKWTWYQLYTILDVYSRYVVGWLVAPKESAILAEQLIADAIYRHEVGRRTAHLARRPGHVDDVTDRQPAAGRPRRAPEPLPTAPVQRQPLLRGPVQDAQVLTRPFPSASPPSPPPGLSARSSSSTTTTSTATRASGSTPPPTSTTAWPRSSGRSARASSTPPTPPCPDRFRRPPQAPRIPEATWINRPGAMGSCLSLRTVDNLDLNHKLKLAIKRHA